MQLSVGLVFVSPRNMLPSVTRLQEPAPLLHNVWIGMQ